MTIGAHRTNLLRMFLVTVIFIAVIAFLAIVISSGDPAWFVRGFSEQPVRVIVYQGGEQRVYQAGDPGFDALAGAVQASLNEGAARPSSIGLSDESLQDAYQKYLSVEAIFAGPVKLHAAFNTHQPTRMLFLITGRHTEVPLVFMGTDERYLSNAPVLKTIAPLRAVLQAEGFDLTPVN